jgi:serine protease Do
MRRLSLLAALLLTGCQVVGSDDSSAQPVPIPDGAPAPQRITPGEAGDLSETIDRSRRTAITNAVEVASPAVVSVNVTELRQVRVRDPFAGDPFFEYFFGRRQQGRVVQQEVQSAGSGFVLSPDGYIVTNDHVAGNAAEITVAFPNGETLEATLVGTDAESDVALLKVEPPQPLPYLQFALDEEPLVGEWAIALGNPFGLFEAAEPTVTVGVVSAVGRDFPVQGGRVFRDLVQTDAAINRGNSGGPLVNAFGEVMGVNTFIYSQSGGSVGIGFAVPAYRAARIVADLQEKGYVDRSFYTGLNVRTLTPRIAKALGLGTAQGLVVESVDAGSPAFEAGLQPYDVITAFGGEPTPTATEAEALLSDKRPGDAVQLQVLRDGRRLDLTLTLGRLPDTPPANTPGGSRQP